MNKIPASADILIDLLQYLEKQNLQFVLAIWPPARKSETPIDKDEVVIHTSFESDELPRLCSVLCKHNKPLNKGVVNENLNKI
jgi:hypothetical protein